MFYWEIPVTAGRPRLDRTAIESRGLIRTWAQLLDRVDAVAGLVADTHAIPRGSRVGVLSHNGPYQPELYYGISKGGAVVVPLNWRLSDAELGRVAADADLGMLFVQRELIERLPSSVPTVVLDDDGPDGYESALGRARRIIHPLDGISEDDVTLIGYTSGTSGEAKGVMHTHRSLVDSALRVTVEMRLQADDVFFACLPLFFAAGNSAMTAPLSRGCRLIIDDFSADGFLAAVQERRVTATIMVPTMIIQVLNHPDARRIGESGQVKRWSYAGAAIARSQLTAAMELFGPIFSGLYGQLESGLCGTTLSPEDHVEAAPDGGRLGSIGRPTIGCGVRLRSVERPDEDVAPGAGEPGEIWIRSHGTMKGYWRRPELTERTIVDGWLRTGDIAIEDRNGYLYLVDRATDKIVTGGINVFPREIEELIVTHPAVSQVVVVGVPSDLWGEEITACLILTDGADADAVVAEVTELCNRNLSSYKKPRAFVVLDSLPMTGSGKVAKGKLRGSLAPQPAA